LSALEKLKKALQLEPDYVEAHVAMARVYRSLMGFSGFYEEDMHKESDELIMPHLEQALAINPELAEVQLLRGDMSEQVDEAREAYEKALTLNPNLYQAHISLAVLAMDQLRSWNDCVLHLEKAIEIEPLSVEAATLMILFMQRVPHRWPEAEAMLENLERQFPDSSDVMRAKARWLLYVRGQPAESVPILQDLLVKDPDDAQARFLLVRSWYMLGETARALEFKILNPIWRFVLAPDREKSLRRMAEVVAEIETMPREVSYPWRMLYAGR
jgi:tetratricopeptide (TPR) repeat protein